MKETKPVLKTGTYAEEAMNTPQPLHPGQKCRAKPEEQYSSNEALRAGLKQCCLGAASLYVGVCHPRQGILRSEVSLSKGEKRQLPKDSFHSYKSSRINNAGMVLAQGNITYRQHSDEPRINTKIVKLIYQAKKFSSDMKDKMD